MKKCLFLFYAVLLMQSCSPYDIVDDKRILVKGRVTTSGDIPLSETPVKLLTTYSGGMSLYYDNFSPFHEGFSNPEGNFSFTTFDIEGGELMIAINKGTAYESALNEYQSLTFLDEAPTRSEYVIDFGTIQLKRRAELTLQFVNQSGTEENLFYSIEVLNPDPVIPIYNWTDFSEIENPNSDPWVYLYTATVAPSQVNIDMQFLTLENSEAILNYSVGNISEQIAIPITSSSITYEIVY